jgi:AAA+ ATPase superfamily predicted ATPase
MEFVNRHKELERLERLSRSKSGGVVVVWGRRRTGKTRLLLEWTQKSHGIYYMADESISSLQRKFFALALQQIFPDFASVEYGDWSSWFTRLAKEALYLGWQGPLIIDELPYLISSSPELPSVLQKFLDHDAKKANLVIALCGSSQQMMQGAVLAASSPLFGRADEIIKLGPISAGYMGEALHMDDARTIVENYAVWGGIPRYWELVKNHHSSLFENIDHLVLDPLGSLYDEPNRLLLEESSSHLRPILDAIGLGSHRLSEIAARIGQPVTSFTRSMQRLMELDLIEREIPFGEDEHNSKKSLYKINDPFLRFWFKVVSPQRSFLTQAKSLQRQNYLKKTIQPLFSVTWEDLCRSAIFSLAPGNKDFNPAGRYWHKSEAEWDVLTESIDRQTIFIGEAKWYHKPTTAASIHETIEQLKNKGLPPFIKPHHKHFYYGLFVPEKPKRLQLPPNVFVYDAKDVLLTLK